MKNSPTVIRW